MNTLRFISGNRTDSFCLGFRVLNSALKASQVVQGSSIWLLDPREGTIQRWLKDPDGFPRNQPFIGYGRIPRSIHRQLLYGDVQKLVVIVGINLDDGLPLGSVSSKSLTGLRLSGLTPIFFVLGLGPALFGLSRRRICAGLASLNCSFHQPSTFHFFTFENIKHKWLRFGPIFSVGLCLVPSSLASVSAPVAEIWSHHFQLVYTRPRPPWPQPQSQHRWPRFNLHFDPQFSSEATRVHERIINICLVKEECQNNAHYAE